MLVGVVWGSHKIKSWMDKIEYVEQTKSKQKSIISYWKVKFGQSFFFIYLSEKKGVG